MHFFIVQRNVLRNVQGPLLPIMSSTDSIQGKPLSKFTRWYRSPLFNVILVGLISFTQPGIWNALNSKQDWSTFFKNYSEERTQTNTLSGVGAGGQQKPYLVNAANALTYGSVNAP